ncbi:hypothetical protein WM46_04465 [Citrobacter freundii complex sp. CFNIH2]|uniref:AP2/ERF family transcription factor n=1 Tax=Citrobacter freundii complex sp. CFNIH2 TaxID=2066049 RepID=UPI000C86A658|nr:AP2/ERF family transcription factor [Citrobacter freundii complex sp. CFNIH2]AUO64067.1 hypothetical protein WM46_04465 [Citrobacter freundii complex sp. CFNIH2]
MGGANQLPNREQLNEILSYDPTSGKFTWKVSRGKVRSGQPAGSVNSQGYILIKIHGKNLRAHRIAFFMVYGEQPRVVDHIDGDILNNRIANLRAASLKENQQNRKSKQGSSSKFIGVRWKKQCSKWNAEITIRGKKKHIGYFDSEEEAAKAYDREALLLNKNFARLNFPMSR